MYQMICLQGNPAAEEKADVEGQLTPWRDHRLCISRSRLFSQLSDP